MARFERRRRRREMEAVVRAFLGRHVLEIGGPSAIFRSDGLIPIYGIVDGYDAANFAQATIWQGDLTASRPPRKEFVAEATDLGCPDATYGGILASHVLEHVANPLGALREWRRVVAPGSPLLVIVPHRDFTFDRRREITSLDHLLADERQATGEDDLTHVPEVIALHDLRRDCFRGDAAAFARRCWANLDFRAMHHHVFNTQAAVDTVLAADLVVDNVVPRRPYHIVVLARRPPDDTLRPTPPHNLRRVLQASPFPSDRKRA